MLPSRDSRAGGCRVAFRREVARAGVGLREDDEVLFPPVFLLEVRFFLRVIGMESL
jgi:hypothetical protein